MTAIAQLGPGDEAELERFLVAHADSSMFLRSNSARAGLVDRGEPLHGTYVAARDDTGAIVAVAAHCWNGMMLVQGRVDAIAAVVRDAAERTARSGRAVTGFSGPHAQVVAARAAFGWSARAARLDAREDLFTLALANLRVPSLLDVRDVVCRALVDDDAATVARWSYEYELEALGMPASDEREARIRRDFAPGPTERVLSVDGVLVATSTFNAQLPDTVQVGGVYTPPEQRRRGYARAVVAGSLVEARARGVTRSILFTDEHNVAARTAYLALGYTIVGDYGLVLFD